MPEHLRALVVILGLAVPVFLIAKSPACALATAASDFERRRNVWFALVLVAFLAHNYWVYVAAAAIVLLLALPRETNRLAMFFFLLFALSAIPKEIPGFGLIDHFFTINYVRLLALTVLLPAFVTFVSKPDTEPIGRPLADKLLLGYLALDFLLQLPFNTLTNAVRHGIFYAFIDVYLPYYVASRSLRSLEMFRDALMSFAVAAMVLAAIAVVEFGKGWLLYTGLESALGSPWGISFYLRRDGNLRALATAGQPIALGYVFAVALGFFLYLRRAVPNPAAWGLGFLMLGAGLIAALSRGPWVGAVAIVLCFVALGPSAGLRMTKLSLLGLAAAMGVLASPLGPTLIDHLPFIGTIDERNVIQRQRLLEVSLQVIMQNPVFGSIDARFSAPMEQLRMGDGIIDIVNSYLRIALRSGFVGLSLFVGFFAAVGVGILRAMRGLADREFEEHALGQALLATLLGILLIIYTVSSVTVIPVIYWSVAGLGVAYARMLRPATVPSDSRTASYGPVGEGHRASNAGGHG